VEASVSDVDDFDRIDVAMDERKKKSGVNIKVRAFVMKMYVKGALAVCGGDEVGRGDTIAWSTKCDAVGRMGNKKRYVANVEIKTLDDEEQRVGGMNHQHRSI